MLKIGEFSKLTQVTVRMLRYYDEMGLLKPLQIDPWTGYRMYSITQIPVLNKIIYLRDSGFNVAEIAGALNREEDSCAVERLDKKHEEIRREIEAAQQKLKKIELARAELQSCRNEMYYNVSIKSIPSYQVLSLRRTVENYYAEGHLWKEMEAFITEKNIAVTGLNFAIYHDLDYREEDVDMEICVPVARMGEDAEGFTFRNTEPVSIMASTMVYGPFENIAGAFQNFSNWLLNNQEYQFAGTSRQIVHRGPWNEKGPDAFLTEIQIPLLTLT